MNDFSNIKIENFDYDVYWKMRGAVIRSKLLDRESIFFDWITSGSKVLDVAVGSSALPSLLVEAKSCQMTAFDISTTILEKQSVKRIETHIVDLSSDDFYLKDNYDYIILSEILEHLQFPEKLILKTMSRAKFLLISIPNSAFYRFRLRMFFKGKFLKQWVHHPAEHLRFWSHKDFLDWLDVLGLKVIESKPSNGLDIGPLKFYKILPNLFGHQICYLIRRK